MFITIRSPNLTISRLNSTLAHLHKSIAGVGDPYRTENQCRKRPIRNPNEPDFEKQECLKWAKWNMLKDVKRRQVVSDHWQFRMNMRNIKKSTTLPSIIREIAHDDMVGSARHSAIGVLQNRCSLTSRPRGNYTVYRICRNVWRDLADHGLLSGHIRAKWG